MSRREKYAKELAEFTAWKAPAARAARCLINRALVASMDWDAVRAWLDR